MSNKLLLLLVLITSYSAQSQMAVKQPEVSKLPKGIRYEGEVITTARWTDSLGDNIVITTESGAHESKKWKHLNEGVDAEVFAYRFLVKNDSVTRTWRVYDNVIDCPVDLEAVFIKNTFQVTDLNKDGVGEVWLMYKKVCHGDVSPYQMRIIMYQGNQKFAMRGRNKVFTGTDEDGVKHYDGGEYTVDQAFAKGPKVFLDYAKKLWNKNIMETFNQ